MTIEVKLVHGQATYGAVQLQDNFCWDTSCTFSRHILHTEVVRLHGGVSCAFKKCLARIPDGDHCLGAELYCIHVNCQYFNFSH